MAQFELLQLLKKCSHACSQNYRVLYAGPSAYYIAAMSHLQFTKQLFMATV
jgi:hypothetical protein